MAELNAALNLDTRAKKWKYKFKYIFHLLERGLNPQPVGFTVTPRAAALRLASNYIIEKLESNSFIWGVDAKFFLPNARLIIPCYYVTK